MKYSIKFNVPRKYTGEFYLDYNLLEKLIEYKGTENVDELSNLKSIEIKNVIENSNLIDRIENELCIYGHDLLAYDGLNSPEYNSICRYKECIESKIIEGITTGNLSEADLGNIAETWDWSGETRAELAYSTELNNFSGMFSSCFELVQYNEEDAVVYKVYLNVEDFDNEDDWDHWPGEERWYIMEKCEDRALKEIDINQLLKIAKNNF